MGSSVMRDLLVIPPQPGLLPQPLKLAKPTGLTATPITSTKAELEWTDESSGELGFSIERKTGSGEFVEITQAETDETSFTDSGLDAATTYTYRVKAVGNGLLTLDSEYSNEAVTTTGGGVSTTGEGGASVTTGGGGATSTGAA